jgi:hypothetical protein
MSPSEPTPEEVAAIAAAVEALWPRPSVAGGEAAPVPSRWKFSGRWWLSGTTPAAAGRRRP